MYAALVTSLRNQVRRNQTFGLGTHEDTGLMDRAADAIEELQQTANHYKGCADDWYKEACDYKAAVPNWISVKERLPDGAEDVLLWTEWKGGTGIIHRSIQLTSIDEAVYQEYKPLAWMPLPAPPKEE